MSDEGYYELAQAIILQAVKDFKPAYLRLKRCPDDRAATARVKEITDRAELMDAEAYEAYTANC